MTECCNDTGILICNHPYSRIQNQHYGKAKKSAFRWADWIYWRKTYRRQSLKYCGVWFYKLTCGTTVCVPVKTEDEVKIQLPITNSFGFMLVILVRSTGSSRNLIQWNSLFYSFYSLTTPLHILCIGLQQCFWEALQINSFLKVAFLYENKYIEWSSIPEDKQTHGITSVRHYNSQLSNLFHAPE